MNRRIIKTAGAILILAAVLVLGGCGASGTFAKITGGGYEKEAGELAWLMEPNRDCYLVNDGNEPADSYDILCYNDSAKAYYISYPFKKNRYITPEGEPLSMTGEYAYLAELPLVQRDDENGMDYYAFADGTRAFEGDFFAASEFEGEYADAYDRDWHGVALDKKGNIVYRTESGNVEFYHAQGSIFVEIKDRTTRFVDVKKGEAIHTQKDCDAFTKVRQGWVLYDVKKEKCFLVDEDFMPLWGGRLFDSISEGTGGDDELIYATEEDGRITYRDKDGTEIFRLKKGERGFPGDGRILVYTENHLLCYNYGGKKLFTKEMTKVVNPEELFDVSGFCDGVAVVTLDGETYGVMDEKGKMLTSFAFEYARVCSNHTIMAAYNQRAGILAF